MSDLIKKRVIVETEIGEIEGLLIHFSKIVIVASHNVPVIIRSWRVIKWY